MYIKKHFGLPKSWCAGVVQRKRCNKRGETNTCLELIHFVVSGFNKCADKWFASRKHAYIILIPLNSTFI